MYVFFSFFFNDTATTEIYTLSLHDALPIWQRRRGGRCAGADRSGGLRRPSRDRSRDGDRKSTRLNSSHMSISYAVFCLKKKNKIKNLITKLNDFTAVNGFPSTNTTIPIFVF